MFCNETGHAKSSLASFAYSLAAFRQRSLASPRGEAPGSAFPAGKCAGPHHTAETYADQGQSPPVSFELPSAQVEVLLGSEVDKVAV